MRYKSKKYRKAYGKKPAARRCTGKCGRSKNEGRALLQTERKLKAGGELRKKDEKG